MIKYCPVCEHRMEAEVLAADPQTAILLCPHCQNAMLASWESVASVPVMDAAPACSVVVYEWQVRRRTQADES